MSKEKSNGAVRDGFVYIVAAKEPQPVSSNPFDLIPYEPCKIGKATDPNTRVQSIIFPKDCQCGNSEYLFIDKAIVPRLRVLHKIRSNDAEFAEQWMWWRYGGLQWDTINRLSGLPIHPKKLDIKDKVEGYTEWFCLSHDDIEMIKTIKSITVKTRWFFKRSVQAITEIIEHRSTPFKGNIPAQPEGNFKVGKNQRYNFPPYPYQESDIFALFYLMKQPHNPPFARMKVGTSPEIIQQIAEMGLEDDSHLRYQLSFQQEFLRRLNMFKTPIHPDDAMQEWIAKAIDNPDEYRRRQAIMYTVSGKFYAPDKDFDARKASDERIVRIRRKWLLL